MESDSIKREFSCFPGLFPKQIQSELLRQSQNLESQVVPYRNHSAPVAKPVTKSTSIKMTSSASSPTENDRRTAMPVGESEIMDQLDMRFQNDDRIGWPKKSLLSPPVKFKEARDSASEQLASQVRLLVDRFDRTLSVSIGFRYHGNIPGNKTLVLKRFQSQNFHHPADQPNIDTWKKFLVKVRKLMHLQGLHYNIEIFTDTSRFLDPIHSNEHEILDAWTTQYRLFLDVLRQEDFSSLELLRISTRSTETARAAKPRVLISSPWVDSPQWDVVRARLQENLLPIFDLEFEYSSGVNYCTDYQYGLNAIEIKPLDRYMTVIEMGASVGVAGTDVCGSAGARVTLSNCSSDEHFVLTNNHVIECEETRKAVDRNAPLLPSHSLVKEKKVELVSPADTDWMEHYESYSHRILNLAREIGNNSKVKCPDDKLSRAELEFRQQQKRTDEAGENATAEQKQALQTSLQELNQMREDHLAAITARVEILQHENTNFPALLAQNIEKLSGVLRDREAIEKYRPYEQRYLGYLWAASGSRVVVDEGKQEPGWVLDWALAKVDGVSRDISNHVPYFSKQTREAFSVEANSYGKHAQGMKVVKHGRMTGWRTGTINHAVLFVKSNKTSMAVPSVNLSDVNLSDDKEMVEDEMFDRWGGACRAWSFISSSSAVAVMMPGDSGSVVLEDIDDKTDAPWVGLAFGGSEDYSRGYMTPIERVIKDIEKVTECKVTIPYQRVPGNERPQEIENNDAQG